MTAYILIRIQLAGTDRENQYLRNLKEINGATEAAHT